MIIDGLLCDAALSLTAAAGSFILLVIISFVEER